MKEIYKKKAILAGIGGILALIALCFCLGDFVTLKIGSVENGFSGFDIAFKGKKIFEDYGVNGDSYWTLLSLGLILAHALGGIFDAVRYFLIYNGKISEPKKKNQKKNSLVVCFAVILLSLIPIVLNLFVLKTTGFDANPLSHIGFGAILSGILCMVGGLCQGIPPMLDTLKGARTEEDIKIEE